MNERFGNVPVSQDSRLTSFMQTCKNKTGRKFTTLYDLDMQNIHEIAFSTHVRRRDGIMSVDVVCLNTHDVMCTLKSTASVAQTNVFSCDRVDGPC